MRRIKTKKDEAKKRKRNNIILGGILIFVMFFSVIGYGFMGQEGESENKKINYKGYEFVPVNDFWIAQADDFYFRFRNNPLELEDMDVEVKSLNSYQNKPLYILSENQEAELELRVNFDQIVQRIQNACLNAEECEGDYPVKNCDEDNFFIISEAEISKIEQNGTCVFMQGPSENITKITDMFLLKTIGIN